MALRTLSLCAGIGGIDLGLERIGAARTVCYVEREAFPAACLVAAMQRGELADAPVWSDLRTFDARAWRGAVDLIVGGYPCQPFSCAGSRRGADDERHLWPEVLRIFRESGARLLFCENVAGHLSLGFADVLADLAAFGCDVEWDLFRASDVGAPHRRERLFFLAHRDRDGLEEFGIGGLLDGERTAYGHDVDRRGEDVADSRRERDQLGRGSEHLAGTSRCAESEGDQRQRCGDSARDCGADVEHAERARRSPTWAGHSLDAGSQPFARSGGMDWPPGPHDAEGWRLWLEQGGPAPTQSRLRGSTHGLPARVDRLRALGNAVVPQCAALAFSTLTRVAALDAAEKPQ